MLDLAFLVGFSSAVAAYSLLMARRRLRRRSRLAGWRAAVESCGLDVVESSDSPRWLLRLVAREGPLVVRIEDGGLEGEPRLVVEAPVPPDLAELRLRPEPDRPPGAREIEVGDKGFDNAFYVLGPTLLVSALLDAGLRRLLVNVSSARKLEIVGGEVRTELPDQAVADALPFFLQIGRRLAQPLDVPGRLAENARRDPEAGVRLRNLVLLIRELPADPRTAEALRAAALDPSPEMRLQAGRELGAEGRGILVELAEGMEDDGCSAQAVAIVGRELSFERTRAILLLALRKRHLQTARACLERLGRSRDAAAVETLMTVLSREGGQLAATAATALGWTGSPAAERPLIAALVRDPSDVAPAAAIALARVGSAAAVLPLKEAAERHGPDSGFGRAARQAIAEIQSRLPGASPGQLSLDGAEAGRLSLAADPAGQLSLARPEAEPPEQV